MNSETERSQAEAVDRRASGPKVLLVDNGTLSPDAIMQLRVVAGQVAARAGLVVEPVSLLHSHKVDPALIGGIAAQSLKPALLRYAAAGLRSFTVLPCFIGESRALSDFLPQVVATVQQDYPDLRVECLPPLCPFAAVSDTAVVTALVDDVQALNATSPYRDQPFVWAVVDHGTPEVRVNEVRQRIARQLRQLHLPRVIKVIGCSMERREGKEYAFNEPLLEEVVATTTAAGMRLVVSLLFLMPGRHAGKGGDIHQICTQHRQGSGRVEIGEVIGSHPAVIDLLASRI